MMKFEENKPMNKKLKVIFDKALCELVTRITGKVIVYKKPLTSNEIKVMRKRIEQHER